MTRPRTSVLLLEYIRHLAEPPTGAAVSDRDLLQRYLRRRDEAAFAALVRRHGPMVLHVCRQVLGHVQDAKDVFQSTFVVLARKAARLRWREAIAGWLYEVAYRLALEARAATRRRRDRESRGNTPRPAADPLEELSVREAQAALHEELARLPEKYRTPLVLCCLEGMARDEAAQRLGWSVGLVKSRLEQGRELLRRRLIHRSVTLSAALAAALLAEGTTPAAVSPALADLTARAALAVTASGILVLTEGVLQAMRASKLQIAAVCCLTAGVFILGAGAFSHWPRPESPAEASAMPPVEGVRKTSPTPVTTMERMTVSGRVVDVDGKPIAAAGVAVLAGVVNLQRSIGLSMERKLLGQGQTDRDGNFRLPVPRTSSAHNWTVDVVASHAGYGLGWQSFDTDAEKPVVSVRLLAEQILRGRLVDLQGHPAAGVKLQIAGVQKDGKWINFDTARHGELVWPKPIVSDKDGQFLVRGIARHTTVTLHIEHERYTPQTLVSATDEKKTFSLTPGRILEGRVTYADTGWPASRLEVHGWGVRGETDEQGRFRLHPARGPLREGEEVGLVLAYAPEGKPYLHAEKEFRWPKAATKYRIDLALPRGVLVRGRVTEKDSGKPVAGALVIYQVQFNNPNFKRGDLSTNNFANGRDAIRSGHDGTFQIACLPGAGYLTVEGPDADYILAENGGYDRLYFGKRGGQPWPSHGFASLDLKADVKPREIAVALRKGITLKGEIAGPDGQAVSDLKVFCRLEGFSTHPVKIRGNRFELHGCDPEERVRVMLFDAKGSWGATVEMSAKNAGDKPMPVRLQPCGSARVRFLDSEGKPLVHFYPGLFLELTPKQANLRAQTLQVVSPFRKSGPEPHTDEQGVCLLATLIPGATYHFGHAEIETTIRAKAGETLQLPDVRMKTRRQ